jgi:murein DD-endopeptidase MepM/ murein hydrolase activator NlpD
MSPITRASLLPLAVLAATLTPTPAHAHTPPDAAHTAVTVTVHPNDTLSGLAARLCGNQNLWPTIWHANPQIPNPQIPNPQIPNPHRIYPGQRVLIACTRDTGTASRATPRTPPASNGGWVNPVRTGLHATSCWGADRGDHSHKGVDLPAGYGTPIHAAYAGTITLVRYQPGRAGWYVMINHGVYQTVYMHMRTRSFLRPGTRVAAGQTIGYVGATGNAKGPHLHFEIHHSPWHPTNPAPFMRLHGVDVGCR